MEKLLIASLQSGAFVYGFKGSHGDGSFCLLSLFEKSASHENLYNGFYLIVGYAFVTFNLNTVKVLFYIVCGSSLLCLGNCHASSLLLPRETQSQADRIRFIASVCRLRVILRLGIPEFIILSASLSNQLIMAAKLNQTSLVKHSNFITDFAGRQTVTNKYSGLVTYNVIEIRINIRLRNGIEGRCGFIQHNDFRAFIQRSRNRNLLCFPTGNIHSVFTKVFVYLRIQSLGQGAGTFKKSHLTQTCEDLFWVVVCTSSHIASQRLRKKLKILKYHG